MPDQVFIHDVTLRDGEQQAGVMFSTDDKVRIAAKLAEAGVHRIEAGLPAVSEHDARAVREIAKMGLRPGSTHSHAAWSPTSRRPSTAG